MAQKLPSQFSAKELKPKMSRVESKNLFNFPLKGLYDDDVAKESAEMQQKMFESKEGMEIVTKMMEALQKDDEESNMEYVSVEKRSQNQSSKVVKSNRMGLSCLVAGS